MPSNLAKTTFIQECIEKEVYNFIISKKILLECFPNAGSLYDCPNNPYLMQEFGIVVPIITSFTDEIIQFLQDNFKLRYIDQIDCFVNWFGRNWLQWQRYKIEKEDLDKLVGIFILKGYKFINHELS